MLKLMSRRLIVVVTLAAATAAWAQTAKPAESSKPAAPVKLDDPREILKKSQAALKKVKTAEYKVRYHGTGWVENYVSTMEGRVLLGESAEYDVPRFRCELKLTAKGVKESVKMTAGCDGDTYYLVNDQTRTVHADLDEAVLGASNRDAQRALVHQFVTQAPLSDALEIEQIELKPSEKIGGQDCYCVVVTPENQGPVSLYISGQDWMPRKIVRVYKNEQHGEGATVLEIADLKVYEECDLKKFAVVVPPGFKKTDEFAE